MCKSYTRMVGFMINLNYIVPYPELIKDVKAVLGRRKYRNRFNHISIFMFSSPHNIILEPDCNIVIARGYASKFIRSKYSKIPITEIQITGYDIVHAIAECERKFQSKKIAFIGYYPNMNDIKKLSSLFENDICVYTSSVFNKLETKIDEAIADGCDTIIGGNYVNLYSDKKPVNIHLIKTGKEAIERSLDEAIRLMETFDAEKEQSEIFKTIVQHSNDGIIYVTKEYKITIINKIALQLVANDERLILGSNLADSFPFMIKDLKQVMEGKSKLVNELHTVKDMTVSVDYNPITINNEITGVVVNFRDITKIQQMETQIRKKLSNMGLNAKYHFSDIIHKSQSLDRVISIAKKYAEVDSNILIVAETGTGKELMAQSIHNASKRSNGPFVAVNCAAIPENLLESELFGYEDGAFTGAIKGGKQGLFELAHNGTLFLDEISELPISFQGKLLRALQEREIRRIGSNRVISLNVRIIAALNKNLKDMITQATFRQDLLFRLDILRLYIPPLRKHPEDIYVLFMYYMKRYSERFGTDVKELSTSALNLLNSYEFKGNVRELRNLAERISIISEGNIIYYDEMYEALYPDDVDADYTHTASTLPHSKENLVPVDEKEAIELVLKECNYNKSEAARRLGINRTTLWRKINKYKI